jgi:eukaryotic-like serine/threonine-protein kinase
MSFAPCQTIDNYEILGIIEKPRTGVTYKARNLSTGDFEVLRTIPGVSAADSEAARRFFREMKVHTRLSHPNIVAFHDAREMDGQLVMVTEYVDGTTLAERLRTGPLLPHEVIRVAREVLSALEEAHTLGIVHRGIAPEHIVLTRDGSVKLGGFGLAKPVTDINLTQAGAVMGDARYISPEQVTCAVPADGRADLYSVGVVMYEALTGQPPFARRNEYETMVAQVSAQPARPSSVNPQVPAGLEETVLKAMAKDPAARFASAAEFRNALPSDPLAAAAAAATRHEAAVPAPPPAGRFSRKVVLLGIWAAAIAIGGVALLFLR